MSVQKEYIHSMKLAALLMLQGFRILGIEQDKKNNDYDVYVFKHTPELTKVMMNYIHNKNGDNYGINNTTSNNNTTCSAI